MNAIVSNMAWFAFLVWCFVLAVFVAVIGVEVDDTMEDSE